MLRILFACTRTMFNDKLLEYRENGDLERLSRQVTISKLCVSVLDFKIFPNSALIAICKKASAQVVKL